MATFIEGQRNSKKLVYNGFMYQRQKLSADKMTVFWICDERRAKGCLGRAHTDGESGNVAVNVTQQHNHPANNDKISAAEINLKIRKDAVSVPANPRTITSQSISGAAPSTIIALPKLESMDKAIRRKRLADLPFGNATTATRQLPPSAKNDNRHPKKLALSNSWIMDGTFHAAPELFLPTMAHPNVLKLIEGLILEDVRVNATCIQLQQGVPLPLYKKKTYQEANEKLIELINNRDSLNPAVYLQKCADFIHL
ncbi:FLYWCH zinc finger domain-containing protein [Ditylenchus destructor]|nr:FLYWCH zinc finger domain-containing protein [Ditylenchus destructor]